MFPANALIALLIIGLIVGLAFFGISYIPDETIRKWVRVAAVIIVVVWLISVLMNLLPASGYLFQLPHTR